MKRFVISVLSLSLIFARPALQPAVPQTRERIVTQVKDKDDVIRVDVNLVILDALVIQQKTGRVVGDLRREDFILSEDNIKQQIAYFSQDTLPLSVLLLIDRGGCLDPFGSKVRQATIDAIARLKPMDEIALMSYHDKVELIQDFTRDRTRIAEALDRLPGHDEKADHCLNRAFFEAAHYMAKASNASTRRVIITITGVTSNFDCTGPSGAAARQEIAESGAVVCGLIPRSPVQQVESGTIKLATGVGGLFKAHTLSVNQLANESGGEVLADKPETLDRAFNTLMEHLRTRYSMGFVSSNKKRDGSLRKLKLEIASPRQGKGPGRLVVKTKRSYIAARDDTEQAGNNQHK